MSGQSRGMKLCGIVFLFALHLLTVIAGVRYIKLGFPKYCAQAA